MCTCDACGKGYSGKKALEKHINVHTGDDVEVDEDDTGSSSFSDSSGEDDAVNQHLFACEKFSRGLGEPHCGEYFSPRTSIYRIAVMEKTGEQSS